MLNYSSESSNGEKSLKLALFATGSVGVEIANFLSQVGNPPKCLILDTKGSAENRDRLMRAVPAQTELIESSSLKEEKTLAFLRKLELDLSILAWWPYILKSPLISIAHIGTLNFHPSLLPYNRGKHYNFWTIIEESPFGVTLHWVNEGVDTGEIAFQREIVTTWEDTGLSLYEKAESEIISLFKESWPIILSKNIPRIPQPKDIGSYHHSRELEPASEIKLSKTYTGRELLNLLRARTFLPHPGAWFLSEDGKRYQVRVQIDSAD